MSFICFLSFLSVLSFLPLATASSEPSPPIEVGFEKLFSLRSGQEVLIRGFLYKSLDNRWILASDPNLKSCCVGIDSQAQRQIILEGAFDERDINKVIAVQGIWSVYPTFTLHDSKQMRNSRVNLLTTSILLLLFSAFFSWSFWYFSKRPNLPL